MTALSESSYLMSIHSVFSWPILTLLLFSQIRKPVLDSNDFWIQFSLHQICLHYLSTLFQVYMFPASQFIWFPIILGPFTVHYMPSKIMKLWKLWLHIKTWILAIKSPWEAVHTVFM